MMEQAEHKSATAHQRARERKTKKEARGDHPPARKLTEINREMDYNKWVRIKLASGRFRIPIEAGSKSRINSNKIILRIKMM